jgi:hypothetical protein
LAALALARTEDLAALVPGNVEEETVWPQLLEEEQGVVAVIVVDDALLLAGEIQHGGGFSPGEFRRGY